MTDVTLQNVRKEFDGVVAVKNIDLQIPDGAFVTVVGPSGCGKSTTLRLIAGLERATDGTIQMGNQDVTGVEPKDRDVAMVFQNYALYPHMTARRNITFGMKSAGDFSDEEIDRQVREATAVLDIDDLLDRKPGELSGGERQRVALGRALVRDPEVFLMDEPLSNLDAKLRIKMRAELAKLHGEFETTTIYVTHDQTEALTLGDRVVVMNDGRIQQVDSPQHLYDFPETRFVAEFIGDPAMNMLAVDISRDGTEYEAVGPTFRIPLPDGDGLETAAGGQALLGVRPESLSVADSTDRSSFAAEVTVTEPLGDSLLLECRTGDQEFKLHAEPRTAVEPGDRVALTVETERLHLFDPQTGEAIYHAAAAQPPEETSPIDSTL
ncbi:sugar ABC transporter ATP-binding protein [Haloarcula hispanica N601]|uniref:ABC-type D-xylose/L-arabinose transporter n=3 Tax=Haloarcula hispanica TaxID=51589 RepID=V5TR14_HALHI|nr:ABC transporter ATP-binding protein [Haloarcula hispanica]AEM59061.1 sugar ABC transporter ATP-binding protein [Haloarcula hispanica ATCC 33960]AHB67756.1 sugar ABC transporter ATP-binding protein [Haloarcula hispanica N601]MCJ0618009.1 ABC transporter ATP-binding protein [Haloarcula hispanica]RYJ15533.1 ABC transporter ATP-binding protein [Haloarcula hispanica]